MNQTVVANGKQAGSDNFAKMSVGMTQVDIKTYQAVVDRMYQKVIDQLKAEGYEIISDEEVANSEFAKKSHNGKTVFCQYTSDPYFAKGNDGGEMVTFWPTRKFIVANYSSVLGTWPTKFGKAIGANAVSIILNLSPVTFDGSRRSGYKGGARIEATPGLIANPYCLASNERGGLGVWSTPAGGNSQWVGPRGMFEIDHSVTIFGSVKGAYIIDVNEDVFLAEVESLGSGMAKGFVTALLQEVK